MANITDDIDETERDNAKRYEQYTREMEYLDKLQIANTGDFGRAIRYFSGLNSSGRRTRIGTPCQAKRFNKSCGVLIKPMSGFSRNLGVDRKSKNGISSSLLPFRVMRVGT